MRKWKLLVIPLVILIASYQPSSSSSDVIIPRQADITSSTNLSVNKRLLTLQNQSDINVVIDGKYVSFNGDYGFPFVDTNNRTQVPLRIVSESYGIQVTWDQEAKEAILKKDNITIRVLHGASYIYVNNVRYNLDTAVIAKDNRLYVPIRFILEHYGCIVEWDDIIHSVVVISKDKVAELPQFYDGRKTSIVTDVKNQGALGTCWAFANIAALESALMPNSYWNFSEDHMTFNTGYNITQNTGGNNMMATAYLLSWKGPVREKDDPYGDGSTTQGLKSVVNVQGYQTIKDYDKQGIKKAVLRYGGVQTSLYMPLANSNSTSNYYNPLKNSLYYDGARRQNHDVVIIGWDDNYPATNFAAGIRPASNGAFICKNSWGSEFGDKGYIYISYESTQFLLNNLVYTRVDEVGKYDNIYQADLLGWVGTVGYGKTSAFFSNVYTTKGKEIISAAGFYAVEANTSYQVYVVAKFTNSSSLNSRTLVAEGKLENIGYYTIDFKEEIILDPSTKYAVIVKATTEKPSYQIPIEYVSGDQTKDAIITDGEGYRSHDGRTWDRVETKLSANVCLKVYTRNVN